MFLDYRILVTIISNSIIVLTQRSCNSEEEPYRSKVSHESQYHSNFLTTSHIFTTNPDWKHWLTFLASKTARILIPDDQTNTRWAQILGCTNCKEKYTVLPLSATKTPTHARGATSTKVIDHFLRQKESSTKFLRRKSTIPITLCIYQNPYIYFAIMDIVLWSWQSHSLEKSLFNHYFSHYISSPRSLGMHRRLADTDEKEGNVIHGSTIYINQKSIKNI